MTSLRHLRKKVIATLATTVLLTVASNAAIFAADTLTPPVVVATVEPGESFDVKKELHLDGLPASADIIVAVDTTGSMGTPIAQAKADAIDICNDVQTAIPGARFAVMDFEDYFPGPGQTGDVPYALKTPLGFTSSCAVFSAAIGTMTAEPGSGGDAAEAYNRAFFEAYADSGNPIVLTRNPQASQFLVVLGDAEPHSATSFGSCPAMPPDDLGRDGLAGNGDDLNTTQTIDGLIANEITLLMIRYITGGVSVDLSCYEDMADATDGEAVDQGDAPDIGQFIIDNAQETSYMVDLEVSAGCQIGLSFNPAPPYGPFTGEQTINFTETITAPTVAGNYTCTVTAVMDPGGPTKAVETINLTVTAGDPATLILMPPAAMNPVGAQHCVTATVRDAFGNPVPDVTVYFSVEPGVPGTTTFPTPASGSAVTDSNGQATFCYRSSLPGVDRIEAYADTNSNGVQDPTEPFGEATKTWTPPLTTQLCDVKITDGGWIITNSGNRANFGGNANSLSGPVKGQQEYQDKGGATQPAINVHSIELTAITCTNNRTSASIYGTATINGTGEHVFRIDVTDLSKSGGSDSYGITLDTGYMSGQQTLRGGQITIH